MVGSSNRQEAAETAKGTMAATISATSPDAATWKTDREMVTQLSLPFRRIYFRENLPRETCQACSPNAKRSTEKRPGPARRNRTATQR